MYTKFFVLFFLLIGVSNLSAEAMAKLKGGLLEKYSDEINKLSTNPDNQKISLSPNDEAALKLAIEKSKSEAIKISIYKALKDGYSGKDRVKYENEIKAILTNLEDQNGSLSPEEEASLKLAIEKSNSESIITSIYNTIVGTHE